MQHEKYACLPHMDEMGRAQRMFLICYLVFASKAIGFMYNTFDYTDTVSSPDLEVIVLDRLNTN